MVLTLSATAEPLAIIDAQLSQAQERKVPVAWWVGPSNPYPDLAKVLENKGFMPGAELTGMAVDLQDLYQFCLKTSHSHPSTGSGRTAGAEHFSRSW